MIDYDYRIIFKKARFYVQERKKPVHKNEIVNWETVKIPFRQGDYDDVCTVGGSVGNLHDAKRFTNDLIEQNTYDVVFDSSYEGIKGD